MLSFVLHIPLFEYPNFPKFAMVTSGMNVNEALIKTMDAAFTWKVGRDV